MMELNEFGTRTENCDGHVIEAYFGPKTGWRKVSEKFQTEDEARGAMDIADEGGGIGYELRVYESLVMRKR